MAKDSEFKNWMSEDRSFEDEINYRLSLFPEHSQLEFIDNCGHMVHLEQPKGLAEIIKKFI